MDVMGGDGHDPDGCATCGATLLVKKSYREGRVWICCTGCAAQFELGPALVEAVYPDVALHSPRG